MKLAENRLSASARGMVLTKATLRAAERLGLSGRQLGDVLGLSEATISRMRSGSTPMAENSKPYQLAALLVRCFRSLDAITGGDERVARSWLTAHNSALGGRPIDRIRTPQGLVDVATYLDARRATL